MSNWKRLTCASLASAATIAGCNLVLGVGDYAFDLQSEPSDAGGEDHADSNPSVDCNATNKPVVDVVEVTENTRWTCDKDYLLVNQVYVRPGATLTIDPGTTVKGRRGAESEYDKVSVLVVQPGAKIHAVGTADSPIVFTSASPSGEKKIGDWGGIILLGKATVNQGVRKIEGLGSPSNEINYGAGSDDEDSSGQLKYVRIEYGGYSLSANNEINGLTLGGVGRATLVDYVQVRFVADDCFEFFGGTVNASHLLCQYSLDDGIDWDFGYRGKIQFAIVQLDPNVYDTGDNMNGIEADNGGTAAEWQKVPVSEPTLFNLTLCGPGKRTPARPTVDGGAGPLRIRYGMVIRRHSKARINNTIVTGFEAGFNANTYPSPGGELGDAKSSITLRNVIFFGNTHFPGSAANVAFVEAPAQPVPFLDDDQGYDEVSETLGTGGNREMDPGITGCFNAQSPSFGPAIPIPSGSVVPDPNDDFFVSVDYIGAVRDVSDPWPTHGRWPVWSDR